MSYDTMDYTCSNGVGTYVPENCLFTCLNQSQIVDPNVGMGHPWASFQPSLSIPTHHRMITSESDKSWDFVLEQREVWSRQKQEVKHSHFLVRSREKRCLKGCSFDCLANAAMIFQEEQDGKQTRFFWIFFSFFLCRVGESMSGWMNSCE